ncbi:MAG: DEAD/DEAH box helicase [Clostridioides sp.]|jgi:superfamily II DNA or RNA helicase/HKD family nuclease|nr:DEAD/DEAH box helicase [Clostridioides sp.]
MGDPILLSAMTALIDKNFGSSEAYRPKLLFNDYKRASKVLNSIQRELNSCDEFIFSVAFITMSGVTTILETLKELEKRGIRGRILTTNYLNFNEPNALRKLKSFSNIEIKMLTAEAFHTKGYIFRTNGKYNIIVGSSNLTQNALAKNKEWNLKVTSLREGSLTIQTVDEFEHMWKSAGELTNASIDEYEKVYKKMRSLHFEQKQRNRSYANDDRYNVVQNEMTDSKCTYNELTPNSMQIEAIKALSSIREEGKDKALIISATGTGKTYMSAFDVKKFKPDKMLFIVHREQILKQAMESFKQVIGKKVNMGILSGNSRDTEADYLFSTVQMMSREDVRREFHSECFDYIIIDESHKAGADSYKKIIDYFSPKFLLGMTATPERTDGFNIYELFDYNIAYEIRLQKAMEEEMLCPFHYFGITDLIIDGSEIEDKSDFRDLISSSRVDHIIDKIEFYGHGGDRLKGLVFCSRKDEGRELSAAFNERGYRTVFLCGEDSQDKREDAIQRLEQDKLEGALDYIFTVDIFNEGIDIPEINQIVMLRPTMSSIIFTQQLGRGLRKTYNKEFIVVVDFIGNYDKNFLIPVALSGDKTYNKDSLRNYILEGNCIIPGCSTINFDSISKERIFESLNKVNFSKRAFLKEEYQNLKNKLGKIPSLRDFYRNGSIDPELIIEYSKNYYSFLKSIESEYDEELSEDEENLLEFISTQINGKRVDELLLLKLLIENKEISTMEFRRELKKYTSNDKNKEFSYDDENVEKVGEELYYDYSIGNVADNKNSYVEHYIDENIKSSIRMLNAEFLSGSAKTKYGKNKLVDFKSSSEKWTSSGKTMMISNEPVDIYRNKELLALINDYIDYSIMVYRNNYTDNYKNTNFSLYKKYSRKDACRLLNWDSDVSSVVYGYKVKENECPIFVTYNKKDDINDSTKYEDQFVDRCTFSWMTRNKRTIESKEVADILNSAQSGLKIHLFVKKTDGEGKDFYYIGQADPILDRVKETHIKNKDKNLPIVNIPLRLRNEVREDIYEYLIN